MFRCSFAVTGEVIMTAKLLKRMLGDCSINRKVTNIQRMTNDAADFWKPPKSFYSDLLTPRDGAPRVVSRPAGLGTHVASISQFGAQAA